MKRPTTTKGFPETSKRLAECDITRWRHIVSSTTPHPLPNGASATTLRQVIPSLKRCSEVETYRLHLHHPKERAKQTSTDCQSNQYWSPHQVVLVNTCNQYWSTQRLVLVAKPAPHSIGLLPHQSPGSKPLKSTLTPKLKNHQYPSRKTTNHERLFYGLEDQDKLTATSPLDTPYI